MSDNPHFQSVDSWEAAEELLTFRPRPPRRTAGFELRSLSVFVMDHNKRELPIGARSLEAHYGGFSLSQCRKGEAEARRWALSMQYGSDARSASVAGHEGRMYELGPEVPPDDIDGRSPAVVTWHDGEMFYLVASTELPAFELLDIAGSLYADELPRAPR
jgi:hypothetical protein